MKSGMPCSTMPNTHILENICLNVKFTYFMRIIFLHLKGRSMLGIGKMCAFVLELCWTIIPGIVDKGE